jgi:hypothetical protein
MSKGYFTNRTEKPAYNDISDVIGDAKNNWDILSQYLIVKLQLKAELKFYGVNYGWASRFSKSGKYNITLYPDRNCFTVQIILNKNQIESALVSDLDSETIKIIKDTQDCHEGKWIYLRVDRDSEVGDIIKLMDLRVKIK